MATIFNVNAKHVQYINHLLKSKDLVIIHGDGTIFSSNFDELEKTRDKDGKVVSLPAAQVGSNHHREFNSGYDVNEATAKASFRAVYKSGKGPATPEEVVKAFYEQVNNELMDKTTVKNTTQSNIFKLDAEEAPVEVKKLTPAQIKKLKSALADAQMLEDTAKEDLESDPENEKLKSALAEATKVREAAEAELKVN